MSIALARKYRPTTFDNLIGQEAVSQTLTLALDSNRLSHAYLFSGLRGSGKTSTARIFAKALVCEKGTSSKPCEECSNCIMANEGRNIDIIELDGASNRKIDDIRELIEHTKYKPAVARYKIFIIDEVHMLTKEAFNALLKTLEEPPDFVKFILATTDPLKLPATILSRTQHFRFRKISQTTLEKHLKNILDLEGVECESEAIKIIARVGAGSVRDALTLLDQAIVYSKNSVDVKTVTDMLGIIEPSILDSLIDSIVKKDENSVLEFISRADEFEAEMVIDELMLYLKDILLNSSRKIDVATIDRFFRVLADGKSLLAIGSSGEFVLSLTLLKMLDSLKETQIRVIEREPATTIKTEIESKKREEEPKEVKTKIEEKPIEPKKEVIEEVDKGAEKFKRLIEKIYDRNYDLGSCFEKNIEYLSYRENLLTWKSRAKGEERRLLVFRWGMIKMFTQEVFGINIKIKNIEEERPKKEEEIKKESPPPKVQEVKREPKEEKKISSIKDTEMVKKAIELLDPKRVTIKGEIGENS